MYYVNSGTPSAENGDNVFMFFDDFGGNANSGKWGEVNSGGIKWYQDTVSLSQGNKTKLEHGPSQGMGTADENKERVIETRMWNFETYRGGLLLSGPDGFGSEKEYASIYNVDSNGYKFWSDGSESQTANGNTWYVLRVDMYNDNNLMARFYWGMNDENYRTLEWTAPEKTNNWNRDKDGSNYCDKYSLAVWDDRSSNNYSTYYFDWFLVRKYAATEPTTTVGGEESVLPGKPALHLPANYDNDNTPTFVWTSGGNADNHRLLVDNDSNFSSPEENVLIGGTDNTYTVTTPLPDDNYYWKVITINSYGSNSSDIGTFVVDTIRPAVSLTSPANGATNVPVDNLVKVVFSETMDALATPNLQQIAGNPVAYTFDGWSTTIHPNDTATWTHEYWNDNENITLSVSGYRDLAGNSGDNSWSFKTVTASGARCEILTSYTPSSVDMNVYYSIKLKVRDNDGLSNVNVVWLKLYENSLSRGAPDSAQTHYTFRWVRGVGFSEVGLDNSHLLVGNCVADNDNLTTDNWTFRVKLENTAMPTRWNVWVSVLDNGNYHDNEEFANKLTVNPYEPVPTVKVESRPPFLENEFQKENEPVLKPSGDDFDPSGKGFDKDATYNPAVAYENGVFYLFYRAQEEFGHPSWIGLATSSDGIHFENRRPAIRPTESYEIGGCEDPRIIKVGDEWWLIYTGVSDEARLALATSRDLVNWEKKGLLLPNFGHSKSGVILPEKINGKYYMYFEAVSSGDLYYAVSDNLENWTASRDWIVIERRKGYFDEKSIEPGPPPIVLENGILLIYDGWGPNGFFSPGWIILSKDDPTKVIARSDEPFLVPEFSWENNGHVSHTVFTEGLVAVENTWYLYYGAADNVVGLARAPVRDRSVLWSVETKAEWGDGTQDSTIIVDNVSGDIRLVATGVRGWWKFDEENESEMVAYDASGFGNNGTISGASYTTGISDNALEFRSADNTDCVNVGDRSSLRGFSGLTIRAWIYPSSKPANGEIVKKDGVYLLRVNNDNKGKTRFSVWDGGERALEVPDGNFLENQWTMITATWDGYNMRIYKDNAILLGKMDAIFNSLSNSTNSFRIGNDVPSHTDPFDGKIDEVMVLNRAITEDEIRYLYYHPGATSGVLSGEWMSAWQDFGVPVRPENLKVTAAVSLGENARVLVEVSKDGSFVEDNLGWQTLNNGSKTIDLASLPEARYARVKFRLETENMGHSPSVENFAFNGRALHIMVSTDSASFAEDNSVTLKGTLINLENGETQVWFKWREENGATSWNETGKRTVSSRGPFSDNISGLTEDNAYEFRAVVKDLNSGENTTGSILTFIMDSNPPSAFMLLSPENNAVIPQDIPATLEWEASSDNESGISHYEVWLNGINVDNVVENQYPTAPLPKDNYRWYVVAVDRLGNTRASENTFAFTTGIPPEPFELKSPEGSYTLENKVVLSWENSSSRVPSLSLDKYEVWINGAKVGEVPAKNTYYVTPELSQGSYQWYVLAVDQVGNYSQSDNVFTFNVGTPPPYPMREYFDGFEDNNLNGYISNGLDITDNANALYGQHSVERTGSGTGYAYVPSVQLLNFEGEVSVIFKIDDPSSKPGVGFASEDGSWVYAVVDSAHNFLRAERKGKNSIYGTTPSDYWKVKNQQPKFNWGTETQENNFYILDVGRDGCGGISMDTEYLLTLYFSTRSMAAMAVLQNLSGTELARVRAVVDFTPDHPFFLSNGPVKFDNFYFNVIDNWVYNWQVDLNPVLSPSTDNWDAKGAFNPSVGFWDNIFRMYYRGNAILPPPDGPPASSIGYATSSDGYKWTKDPNKNPALEKGVDGGNNISIEDPTLVINPFENNVQYLEYTDVQKNGNIQTTPSKIRTTTDFENFGAGWMINAENKTTAIVDASSIDNVSFGENSYRFFTYMEPSYSMMFSNDLKIWAQYNKGAPLIPRSDETWSNLPLDEHGNDAAEIPVSGWIMPDGNILVATCMSNAEGYVGGPGATVGTAIFDGSHPWLLQNRATLPFVPVYFGDVRSGTADLSKDNRSWSNGPNFPGALVMGPDNWLYLYYGGNDQYTGVARTHIAPEFEYRGLMLSKGIVDPKESFVASVVVRNVGNLDGPENVRLYINGELENSKIVTLGRNNETTVQFTAKINKGGVYEVQAGDMSSTLLVVKPAVAATTPENNSRALLNENVVVVFNKSMDKSFTPTLTQTTFDENEIPENYPSAGWNADNTSVTWTHNDWKENDNITLTVSGYKDLSGNVGDNYTWSFTTFAGAVATGPTGYSNTRDVTITYNYSGSPLNVKIYYTTDNGTTWHLAGIDDTVDDNFGWSAPQDNVYWWAAVVPGVETDPPTGAPEAGPLTIDTVPPLLPENIAATPSGWTSTNSFTVTWENPADLSGVSGAYYKLNSVPTADNDGTLVTGDNIVSISGINAALQGSNTIYVWLKDKAGNVDNANFSSCVLRFDNVAPSVFNLISPENNKRIQDNTPTFTWENSLDNVSGLLHYEVWLDGINVDNVVENQYTSSEIPPQSSHTWYVVAVDNAGNERMPASFFNFILTVEDNTPPTNFDLLSPQNNATIDTATPTLTWENSSDNASGLWHYEVWLDGSNVDNVSLDRTSYTTQLLSESSHQWYVVAVDNAVNKTRSNNIFTFTVRTVSLINYVDPFIGTMYGHVSPGTAVPFAMTSWDPESKQQAWSLSFPYTYYTEGGYPDQKVEPEIAGFRGSHYPSGSSATDYGLITIMPESGSLVLGSNRASSFSHHDEEASPGYYAVTLENYDIRAELTSTMHSGIFKFTYSQAGTGNLLVDTQLGTGYAKVIPENNEIVGYSSVAQYTAPTGVFKGYFDIKINKSFSFGTWDGGDNSHPGQGEITAFNMGAWATFSVSAGETVMVKASMSFISIDQARANLTSEIADWNFDRVRSSAENAWENALGTIEVVGSQDQKKMFYTALYHTMLAPRVSSEGGRYYSVFDGQMHQGEFYDGFSMWDTFRAEQALLILTQPSRVADMAQSLVDMYEQGGWMPSWPDPGYSTLMIATHGDSIIAETYLKGITGFDVQKAYEGMVKNATQTPPTFYKARIGIKDYIRLGYASADNGYPESVGLTLEYAYDDWSIAQLAKALGKDSDYNYYMNRATYYRNVFDNSVGFTRGRNSNGSWFGTTYDPTGKVGYNTQPDEGDSWQYTWFAPHDVWGLRQLIDGSKNNPNYPGDFITKLETLFQRSEEARLIAENQYAEHGTVKYYWHGNEPGEHIPYLFDYAGEPWRTQFWVDNIMKTRYRIDPFGLPGNDDCGQMSTWYVLSAMGFYPVEPPSLTYEIGRPIFDKVTIHLANGKDFVIEAQNVSDTNMYIQSATLDGRPLSKPWFEHSQLESGGTMTFVMGPSPNTSWGSHPSDAPPSISGPKFVADNLSIFPVSVIQGENENVAISVRMTNVGTAAGPKLVRLEVDGSIVDDTEVTLSPDNSQTVSFNITENELGVHIVYIDNLQGTFVVEGGKFLVENLKIYPHRVYLSENVAISVDVANIGENIATKFLVLKIDNRVESIENVTLDSGENSRVSFVVSRDVAGVYEVEIENLIGSFVVENQSGSPNFILSNLKIDRRRVDIGENVTISVEVVNNGDASGSYEIIIKLDGSVKDSDNVTLDPGSSDIVSFVVSMDNLGLHSVEVNQLIDYIWAINSSEAEITKLVEVGDINAGEQKVIDIDGVSITQLVITAINSIDNEQIEILQFAKRPSGVPLAPGVVYKYLSITPRASREEDIENIVIGFKVELSWMSGKGVSVGDITLWRYNPENHEWEELSTTMVKEDGTYAYFEATSTKFSIYAISTKSGVGSGGKFPLLAAITGVVVIAAAIAGGYILLMRKGALVSKRREKEASMIKSFVRELGTSEKIVTDDTGILESGIHLFMHVFDKRSGNMIINWM
jgi:predicted alpha-1,2-mannosidase